MIRKATEKDTDGIWEIFHTVIQSGDTYVFRPETTKEEFKEYWLAPIVETFVFDEGNRISGTYILKTNQMDLGSHIANASYMVHPRAQAKGIGIQMGKHSLLEAKTMGFTGMQFNMVVSSNLPAISLWKKLGFQIIGTIPKAFRHAGLGFVDAHIMFREL